MAGLQAQQLLLLQEWTRDDVEEALIVEQIHILQQQACELARLSAQIGAAVASLTGQTRCRPQQGGQRITERWLEQLAEEDCRYRFGFSLEELQELVLALLLPPVIKTISRHKGVGAIAVGEGERGGGIWVKGGDQSRFSLVLLFTASQK
ncbi:hypothetical protein SISNIDRAFT_485093 [Sistotremastrum niveocremeum HHB9708]|uniref:Uncharacterized protein n=1 Tax=Sistotremastrum niveocremeum HHB9708 TaxID=1314777 RepID=A0A164VHN3_9AGAM|nr:hypothetical protein SISNIDRAFT_485093 [Sistotremastrum niveocremeum HHB9708]